MNPHQHCHICRNKCARQDEGLVMILEPPGKDRQATVFFICLDQYQKRVIPAIIQAYKLG